MATTVACVRVPSPSMIATGLPTSAWTASARWLPERDRVAVQRGERARGDAWIKAAALTAVDDSPPERLHLRRPGWDQASWA